MADVGGAVTAAETAVAPIEPAGAAAGPEVSVRVQPSLVLAVN